MLKFGSGRIIGARYLNSAALEAALVYALSALIFGLALLLLRLLREQGVWADFGALIAGFLTQYHARPVCAAFMRKLKPHEDSAQEPALAADAPAAVEPPPVSVSEVPEISQIPEPSLPSPTSSFVVPLPPPVEMIPIAEWKTVVRISRDGGANSILASHVLNKTAELLLYGQNQVELMMEVARAVREHANHLTALAEDIRGISNQSRLVSYNASIEASRAGTAGRTFHVVSLEMGKLASATKDLTNSIDDRLLKVNQKIKDNQELCGKVAHLFTKVNRELSQFKNLMMRIEQLSVQQTEKLRGIEERGVVEGSRNF